MTRFYAVLLTCVGIYFCNSGIVREVIYEGSGRIVPTFDKGYLLTQENGCQLQIYGPEGKLAFRQQLMGPRDEPCFFLSAAADRDGSIAAAISYPSSAGYRAGIRILDRNGRMISFIDTGRYLPAHICIDRDHSIWSIGWQRDSIKNDTEDSEDYPIVRKYSLAGRETGEFLPRSMWSKKAFPGAASGGYWTIAAADDRIGAIVNENLADADAEWVEWDFNGNLLSRTKLAIDLHGGRAYTSDGRLYARKLSRERGRQRELLVLDRKTGSWMFKRNLPEASALLLGADGNDLVFATSAMGPYRAVWISAE